VIEIACRYLRDPDRAGKVYSSAMSALTSAEAQAALHKAFAAHRSWFENPPH